MRFRLTRTMSRLRAFACLASTSLFDREAVSKRVTVLSVTLDAASCSNFIQAARPHLLNVNGVRSVQKVDGGRRLVLLREALQENNLPPELSAAVQQAHGEIQPFDVLRDYDKLTAQEVLRELLPASVRVPSGFEEVGHVVHLNLKEEHLPHRFLIGQVLLDKLRYACTQLAQTTHITPVRVRCATASP